MIAEPIVEALGDAGRFLTRHRVGDEQDLDRLDRGLDRRELVHEPLVDLQAAGGIDDDGRDARAGVASATPSRAIFTGSPVP